MTDELPAVKNGNTWVSRFSNIVDYLSHHRWQLDGELSGLDKADNIAYVFFFFFFFLLSWRRTTMLTNNMNIATLHSSNPMANRSSISTYTYPARTSSRRHRPPTRGFSNGRISGSSRPTRVRRPNNEQSNWDYHPWTCWQLRRRSEQQSPKSLLDATRCRAYWAKPRNRISSN